VTGPKADEPETVTGERGSLCDRLSSGTISLIKRKKVIPWAMKGGLAIVDQGLITGSNFALGVFLARWLSREQYGAFALGFSIFLLLGVLYQALLLEPMTVFGGSVYHKHLRCYLSALLRIHLFVTLGVFLVLGISAVVAGMAGQARGLPGALAGAALASPCILLLWLARRTFYLQFLSTFTVAAAFLYCVVFLAGLFLAHRSGLLSPFTAFLLMGAGGLLSGALLLMGLRSRLEANTIALNLREIWKRHWNYGRWALASAGAMWIPSNIYYLLVSSFFGMEKAGELRALMNFAAPVQQTDIALSLLLLPYAVRVQRQEARAGGLTWKVMLLCVSGAVVYWVLVVLFSPEPVFHLLYSDKYLEVVPLVPIVGLASIIGSAFFGPAIALRAMESPKSVFVAQCVPSLFCLTFGVPATWALGVRGAVWSITISEALAVVMAVFQLRSKVRSALRGSGFAPASFDTAADFRPVSAK
jgi:O-antigen/teichoic acid export membrane protein